MESPSFENDSIPLESETKNNIKLLAQKQRNGRMICIGLKII
jgi:hypothetical protein